MEKEKEDAEDYLYINKCKRCGSDYKTDFKEGRFCYNCDKRKRGKPDVFDEFIVTEVPGAKDGSC